MKKALVGIAAIAALGLSAGSALAADLSVPYYKAPPPPPPAWSWTGFYIGGDVGGRWSDPTWDTTCLEPGFAGSSCPNQTAAPVDAARFFNNNPANFNSTSGRIGVYAGYNWQVSPIWVVGFEGDIAWANNSNTIAGIPGAEQLSTVVAGAPGLDSANVKQTWDGSLRGRLGFLVTPTVMVYGTGGAAFTHASASATCGSAYPIGWCTTPSNIGATSTISSDRVGWTAGGGIEAHVWGNWLARAEWRYSDYGTFSGTMFAATPIDALSVSTRLRTETGLVGLSYQFGGPVAARY
ncbi:MAG: outer membrane beta-barrel protein [Xanthobacteraceae bacterium]